MKPIYRTVKHTYYEECNVEGEHYTVQRYKKFLWWKYWSTLTKTDCSWADCHKVDIKFDTESEAIYAIKKLENGNLAQGWTEEISSVLDFNK
jgi:hypothetical protein